MHISDWSSDVCSSDLANFMTGMLEGRPVVLLLSGISMVNAAMNTQRVLDRFHITHLVFSGIAGGVNPDLHIGEVSVAARSTEESGVGKAGVSSFRSRW